MGADLEPLGVSQRCQGQQTSVSIQHLPLLLLLSLHSLRSSTQHCHKTITTRYRERKTHTRHCTSVCLNCLCVCERLQTHLEDGVCVSAHLHTHMHGYFGTYKAVFVPQSCFSPCRKCRLCRATRRVVLGVTCCDNAGSAAPRARPRVDNDTQHSAVITDYIRPVTDGRAKRRAAGATREETTSWDVEPPTDIHPTNT